MVQNGTEFSTISHLISNRNTLDLTSQNNEGKTALLLAASNSRWDIVKYILNTELPKIDAIKFKNPAEMSSTLLWNMGRSVLKLWDIGLNLPIKFLNFFAYWDNFFRDTFSIHGDRLDYIENTLLLSTYLKGTSNGIFMYLEHKKERIELLKYAIKDKCFDLVASFISPLDFKNKKIIKIIHNLSNSDLAEILLYAQQHDRADIVTCFTNMDANLVQAPYNFASSEKTLLFNKQKPPAVQTDPSRNKPTIS